MPYYRSLGWKDGDCPVSEDYYSRCLALPMYPSLTDEEQQYVIDTIIDFYNR
jgi:dTDP-4-amino-4,6-dideoxygalactose transaminase